MTLKRTFVVEIAVIVAVLIAVAVFVEVSPFLIAPNQTGSIGVFNQRRYAQETVTMRPGQKVSFQFNYTSYDPAILVVNLKFQNWQPPGSLSLYCNGILIVSFQATPSNPDVELTTVTFSGYDLVRPPPPKTGISLLFAYGDEISFLSPENNGYAGTFSYEISIRGSR